MKERLAGTSHKLLYAAIALGLVASLPPVTMALFTDQDSVGSNSFDTGTIALGTSPTSALLTLSGMFPGDSVTAELAVSNDGDGELRYAMSSSVTEAVLSAGLSAKVKSGVTTCTSANMDDDLVGTELFDATLDSIAFGDSSQGAQSGDRTLAAGASENLCFKVLLPTAAGNALQGLTTTATLTFDAEQTKNNA